MSFNAKDMTQGGQIASMRIRMFSQIANIMLYVTGSFKPSGLFPPALQK
ncbi:conjugal transfer protein TraD [Escherichia coli]|nr:conjugal transfer protein TraD [Escherichia coli]EEV3496855.1 conjugal transfer protein TraD [Escherichia coli]EHC1271135.1 conjugal transfer protein TraD [Escherichia coli]EHD7177081.1 conjugal transfer protein TraD [Escherichia coli]EHE0890363.1 conjugal transfer protein TraD [Escherichia coli]MBH5183534.1 conjugal transfer protein TraD [Escherichia coli]